MQILRKYLILRQENDTMNPVKFLSFFWALSPPQSPMTLCSRGGAGFVAYVQSGSTTIIEDHDGTLELTVHDIIPIFTWHREKSFFSY